MNFITVKNVVKKTLQTSFFNKIAAISLLSCLLIEANAELRTLKGGDLCDFSLEECSGCQTDDYKLVFVG